MEPFLQLPNSYSCQPEQRQEKCRMAKQRDTWLSTKDAYSDAMTRTERTGASHEIGKGMAQYSSSPQTSVQLHTLVTTPAGCLCADTRGRFWAVKAT